MFIRQKSLEALSDEISVRASGELHPFDAANFSHAMTSLVDSLNHWVSVISENELQGKKLAADVAHELRTPLAALKTNAQVALKATDEQMRQKALQGIVDSVDKSTRLTQQWLLLSRLSATNQNNTSFSLYKIAIQMITELAPHAIEKEIEIALFPDESPKGSEWEMIGNEKAVHALMEAFLENAIQYTPLNGKVTLSLLKESDGIGFCVEDTGPGILEEKRPSVFVPFGKNTDYFHGGLGLAIAARAADLLHTKIDFLPYDVKPGLSARVFFRR